MKGAPVHLSDVIYAYHYLCILARTGPIDVLPESNWYPQHDFDFDQGTHFTKTFPSYTTYYEFDGKFILFSPKFEESDCYIILHMSWQLCCGGMCKNVSLFDCQEWNETKMIFPSNLKNE